MSGETIAAFALVGIGVLMLTRPATGAPGAPTGGGATTGGGSTVPPVVDPTAGAGGTLSPGNSAGAGDANIPGAYVSPIGSPTYTIDRDGNYGITIQYRSTPNLNTFANGFAPSPGQVF